MFEIVFVCALFLTGECLENGLARTPPMGWMSWERFRCNTDCNTYPEDCISERLFMEMSDMLVDGGYKEAGYEYIIIDDCWLDHTRDKDGKLVPAPDRFPSGLLTLSNYIHKLGLKFGLYEDYGNFTCGGYPGVLGHMQTDAQSFADWGVDYVKLDGCYSDPDTMVDGYPEFGRHLNETGRPMVYSCSWPAYQIGQNPNYTAISQHCNLWRNFDDIDDSWQSLITIVDYYGDNKDKFAEVAGPGSWNDPDMLIIGNFGLSLDQARVQMGMWCLMAAPLIMSNDLRKMRPEFKEILLNREAIKIDQDPLGIQARRILRKGQIDIFARPVLPSYKNEYSAAVGFLNRWTAGTPIRVQVSLSSLGLTHAGGYMARDIFSQKTLGVYSPKDTFLTDVNPTGFVLIRFSVLPVRFEQETQQGPVRSEQETQQAPVRFEQETQQVPEYQEISLNFPGLTGWNTEF